MQGPLITNETSRSQSEASIEVTWLTNQRPGVKSSDQSEPWDWNVQLLLELRERKLKQGKVKIGHMRVTRLLSSHEIKPNLEINLFLKNWFWIINIFKHTLYFSPDDGQSLEILINPLLQHRHCSPASGTASSLHFSWIPFKSISLNLGRPQVSIGS